MRPSIIKIKCKHCNSKREYFPIGKIIPKRPRAKCINDQCGKLIFINRRELELTINIKKINGDHCEKYSEKEKDLSLKNDVLKLLDEGKYASQISRIKGLSVSKISRIIKGLKLKKDIVAKPGKPIFYEVINAGKTYITSFSKKPRKGPSTDPQDNSLIKIRIHKLKYYQNIIYNPFQAKPILYDRFIKIGEFHVKKIRMNNWDQYYLYFSYPQFRGLENIQITTQKIIYSFNRRGEDQMVYRAKDIEQYEKERLIDCEKARLFLEANGFETTGSIKALQNSKHYAVPTLGKGHIAETGRLIESIIDLPDGEKYMIDESEDAEEETTNKDKARSYLELPSKLDHLENEVSSIKGDIAELTRNISNLIQVFSNTIQPKGPNSDINFIKKLILLKN